MNSSEIFEFICRLQTSLHNNLLNLLSVSLQLPYFYSTKLVIRMLLATSDLYASISFRLANRICGATYTGFSTTVVFQCSSVFF